MSWTQECSTQKSDWPKTWLCVRLVYSFPYGVQRYEKFLCVLKFKKRVVNFKLFKWSIRHPDLSGLFKLINAVMSSTMTGYSPILNAERGTLNAELFKWSIRHPDLSGLFKLFNILKHFSPVIC